MAPADWLRSRKQLANQLFADSGAESWGLTREAFVAALEHSACKRFSAQAPSPAQVDAYFSALHLKDMALACACADGHAGAWEYFVTNFRGYLRSAAGAILRCPAESPASCELADSLFADLYGMGAVPGRRSLFRYFHGRSSLRTWLRAVLAQRHVDSIRAGRRFTELESEGPDGHAGVRASPGAAARQLASVAAQPDPHRAELIAHFRRTLEVALGLLDPRDKERLRMYYAAEQTLAEIGRQLGEHESSVSRNLERTRRALRNDVEQALRTLTDSVNGARPGAGLSDEQIALCFEYAAEDAPIDLDQLLPEIPAAGRKSESKKP
jgi:RNA polymerase sigma factor (sigma-70 family)